MNRIDKEELLDFANQAEELIRNGAKESPIRHLLSIHLLRIFPDRPYWITEWATKSEMSARYDEDNAEHIGAVDNVVGKTAVEVEKNLQDSRIFKSGYHQVKQYCAALLNDGCKVEDVLGILTDTVRWYGYKVRIVSEPTEGHSFGPDNIELILNDEVDLSKKNENIVIQFEQLVNNYIDRKGLYPITAERIRADYGFYSRNYKENIKTIKHVVHGFFEEESKSSLIVKTLWIQFVDYMGGDTSESFDEKSYSDELYLSIFVKLFIANIIERRGLCSSDNELTEIIDGRFFQSRRLVNFVEYDYFGWTTLERYREELILVYRSIQNSMISYDFESIRAKDMLGPILSNLVNNNQRILLGQEYTPSWLAERMTKRVMAHLEPGEKPKFLDMCCGTGIFLISTIQETISRFGYNPDDITEDESKTLMFSATGFDVDPLSVMMAKANWIICMRDYIEPVKSEITIPIYHADSLFSKAIITQNINYDYQKKKIEMNLDGECVSIPGELISNEYQGLFDNLVDKCHLYSTELAKTGKTEPEKQQCADLLNKSLEETNCDYKGDLNSLRDDVFNLVKKFTILQIEGRNGIWSFVIGNSYRPGLVNGSFNGIVSNPPWLSLSKIRNNPYGEKIRDYFKYFDIMPSGESAPHLDISTVFLLSSADRYLKENKMIGCLLPDSILNGKHMEPFRKGRYKDIPKPVILEPTEIWDIDKSCFKSKSIALFSLKSHRKPPSLIGLNNVTEYGGTPCEYYCTDLGGRVIWSTSKISAKMATETYDSREGADVMDRDLFFYNIQKQSNGKWTIKSMTKGDPEMKYISSDVKKWHDLKIQISNLDDDYVFSCYLSKHVLPFMVSEPTKVVLPLKHDGDWKPLSEEEKVMGGHALNNLIDTLCTPEIGFKNLETIYDKLNTRNKLTAQNFESGQWLVLIGAGGSKPCAAYVQVTEEMKRKIIIDQTLYWQSVNSEEEALFLTGMINSEALSKTIENLQPKGNLGKRHVHKTYEKFIPKFDNKLESHQKLINVTKKLISEIMNDPKINRSKLVDPNSTILNKRRKVITDSMKRCNGYVDYENACQAILNGTDDQT